MLWKSIKNIIQIKHLQKQIKAKSDIANILALDA